MKKFILICSFGLLGTFTMANDAGNITHKVDYAPEGGWCTVTIYRGTEVVYTETSWQNSASACSVWAAGRFWEFKNPLPIGGV